MKKYIIASSIALFALASVVGAQNFTFLNNLSVGASSSDVVNLQTWLISNGYDIPALSSGVAFHGYFGSQTKTALMKYQFSNGIPNTGYFGPMTRGRMNGGDSRGASPLNVISPNGGEVWQKGTTQTIRWNAPYYFRATYADIKLVPYYQPCTGQVCPMGAVQSSGAQTSMMYPYRAPYTISTNISINQNSYSWKVGNVLTDGNLDTPVGQIVAPDGQYTIQVCETGTNNCDSSNSPFTITSSAPLSVLKVTSPNGGEVWQANSTHRIAWSVTDLSNVDAPFDIYLDQANIYCITTPCGSTYVLDRNIMTSTIYNWIVATDINNVQIPAADYRVRVCIAGSTTNCDSSDSSFTISSTLLRICPSQKIVNQMPVVTGQDYPAYYILNGQRRELTEFDQTWVQSNCTVPQQIVY